MFRKEGNAVFMENDGLDNTFSGKETRNTTKGVLLSRLVPNVWALLLFLPYLSNIISNAYWTFLNKNGSFLVYNNIMV